jgi:predicted amidohydrolase
MKANSISIKVAAIQMNCVLADLDANLLKAKALIDVAVEQGGAVDRSPRII